MKKFDLYKALKILIVFSAMLLINCNSYCQNRRPVMVIDFRWETTDSRTLGPHFALAQRLMTEGFAGDVLVLVDNDYLETWATGLNHVSFVSNNAAGGQLKWVTPSQLAAEPVAAADVYVRLESSPQDIASPIVEVEGLTFIPSTIFFKISLLENSDRAAVEALLGGSASPKNFDGWMHFAGTAVELQSIAMRIGVPEILAAKKLKSYSELFLEEEAAQLAAEIIKTYENFSAGVGGKKDIHSRFMDFSQSYTLLKSRLRLQKSWEAPKSCAAKLAKTATPEATPQTGGGFLKRFFKR